MKQQSERSRTRWGFTGFGLGSDTVAEDSCE